MCHMLTISLEAAFFFVWEKGFIFMAGMDGVVLGEGVCVRVWASSCVHSCAYVGAHLCVWRGEVFKLLKPVRFFVLLLFLEADFDEVSPITVHRASNHVAQRQPPLTMHLPLPGERKRRTKWIIQMIISCAIIPVFKVTYRTEYQHMSHWQSINRNNLEDAVLTL